MEIVNITETNEDLAQMVAQFRVELRSYRGISAQPNVESAYREIENYLTAGFPLFAARIDQEYAGYVVCRIDGGTLWVESLFVKDEYRRRGIASALFDKAEALAESLGEETAYNYVHPNNHRMIEFLRKRGYTVLNLIEIRKPRKNEKLATQIMVGDHTFDY